MGKCGFVLFTWGHEKGLKMRPSFLLSGNPQISLTDFLESFPCIIYRMVQKLLFVRLLSVYVLDKVF